jgi:tRNA pseudouridine38-40 synthase
VVFSLNFKPTLGIILFMKFAMRLSYLGKNYCGWQVQLHANPELAPKFPSIQETVEAALSRIIDQPVKVVASGRTDAGVNSVGQVIHFFCEDEKYTPYVFKRGMNSLLPPDIRVMEIYPVAEDFHSQRSATHKQYSFYFQQGPCALPHLMDTTWWINKKLDLEAMREGLSALVGEHDFKPFQASGAPADRSTVRRILEAEISEEKMPVFPGCDLDDLGFSVVRVRIIGTGFLKQMVRGIAGTLLQMGEGYRPASDMKLILDTQDRKKVGPTAAAKGLTLEKVWYKT